MIIVSLPGYPVIEGLPTNKDWELEDSARLIDKLMSNFGFEEYFAQGGDAGSLIASILSPGYDRCVGIHRKNETPDKAIMYISDCRLVNTIRVPLPAFETLTEKEQQVALRVKKVRETGLAYAMEYATCPSTIGFVLSLNPLSQIAWIGEEVLERSDEDPPLDAIFIIVSLYWFTRAYPRSIYPYRAIFSPAMPEEGYPSKPTGFSWFVYKMRVDI